MIIFSRGYFILATLLFFIEVFIALFVNDNFVRPYIGDVLVVILIYCFIRSFVRLPVFILAISVLAFAFTIEFLQYINIVGKLGLENSSIARTVIGTSFAWIDLVAYVAGIVILLAGEKYLTSKAVTQ